MHDQPAIENILARLMPPALSEHGQQDIETMLDELATEAETAAPRPRRPWWMISGGIAAALAAGVFVVHFIRGSENSSGAMAAAETPDELIVMSESGRVETVTDEGWSESPDGAALRTLRLRVVEENRIFDEQTGIVMNISQPREELLLMPVSAF
jgi:hypothetical protein